MKRALAGAVVVAVAAAGLGGAALSEVETVFMPIPPELLAKKDEPAAAAAAGGSCSTTTLPKPGPNRQNSKTVRPMSIPATFQALYEKAGKQYGIPWQLLAGVGMIEMHHGRMKGRSPVGASGPMQFMPGTWASYGVDGNGDGRKDVNDPSDAIPAAAKYLVASGAKKDVRAALFAYNRADWYVNDVLFYAQSYGSKPCSPTAGNFQAVSALGYPNGQIPASVLGKLATSPGNMLRKEAAPAFDAMSRAYQKDHGKLICVTDSYRSLAEQIDVRRRKPGLAAVPGKSNHGLGLAVDLGCGINRFGTPEYQWMKANAGRFGFKHPAWAEPGGSKPEPWHWEYKGARE